MFAWLRRLFTFRQQRDPPVLLADDQGLEVRDGPLIIRLAWTAVSRVSAFKRDLFTTDEIILLVESSAAPDKPLILSEEWPGFSSLFGPMERALGVSPGWYVDIMTPPFESTPRLLYDRSGRPPEDPALAC
jgi:hypothetical protein